MATLLLIVIYLAFISLGIPDSLFGAAWPAIYGEFALPVSYANFVTLTCSMCTCISSILSGRLINRFGTDKVTTFSILLTAASLLGISLSGRFAFLVLLAVPLGFGGGAIDSGLNNYVALHYNAMQMNFLHCFYGIGVSLSPYVLSITLAGAGGWRGGYRTVALIQLGIFAISLLSLPLWKKVRRQEEADGEEEAPVTLSLMQMCRTKGLPLMWVMFAAACTVEVVCGTWCSTFLVEHRAMAHDAAAQLVTLYYTGLALGRFASGILSVRLSAQKLVLLGEVIAGAAVLLLILPAGAALSGIALLLIGFGIGPIFPNLMHLTPVFFGRSVSQSIIGTNMASAYIGIMAAPVLFGFLAQHFGAGLLPYYLMIFFVVMLVATLCSKVVRKDENK